MAKRRRFTPEFKAEVVLEALLGESSQAELGFRRHNLSKAYSIFQVLISQDSKHTVLRFQSLAEGVLGRTDMPKG